MLKEIKNIVARFALKKQQPQDVSGGMSDNLVFTPKIIAIVNQKGGCAKTTTAVNVAACLVQRNYRVLLIDLDAQAHASLGLDINIDTLPASIHHVLIHNADLGHVIYPTALAGLDIAPANPLLSGAQLDLAAFLGRESILKIALNKLFLHTIYDYVLLDCSPSLNLVTINALAAAKHVLIPIQTHYYALEGMKELFFTIDTVKERLNFDLGVLGIVVTLFDARLKINHQILAQIQEYFKDLLFDTIIHSNVKLAEAALYRKPISIYAPVSKGAVDYRSLTEEVILRLSTVSFPVNDIGVTG